MSARGAREITVSSLLLGLLLSVVFGAANAYLGLRVGLTVSASIPAAVIAMGTYRFLLRRESLLECNLVQTIGSAGESLAAGMIFTVPAIFMWAREGIGFPPGAASLTMLALCGGMLGVLFMIPLRRSLIAHEQAELTFPEGRACADILRAGAKGSSGAGVVFGGLGLGLVLQFVTTGLKATANTILVPISCLRSALGLELSPALAGVGYIVGPRVASVIFAGSLAGWMILIPLIVVCGGDAAAADYAQGGAKAIWNGYLRYIGAGAIVSSGILSLLGNLPVFIRAFASAIRGMRSTQSGDDDTRHEDLPKWTLPVGVLTVVMMLTLIPNVSCGLGGALMIVLFGFFFAAVSARMVAVVGSSNNPVSGMTIATLVVAALVLKTTGVTGAVGMVSAMSIGTVVCIVAAMAGDTAQDLKTGWILGATPWKQQLGELIGALGASLSIGCVLYLLDRAWGLGSGEIPAPQANLMKLVVEGIMGGTLPWHLLGLGAILPVLLVFTRMPVMPFAIGLYLPIGLNAMIFLGGLVRLFSGESRRGTLFSAGLVAGEGVCGLVLAGAALAHVPLALNFTTGTGGAVVLALLLLGVLGYMARSNTSPKQGNC